MVYFKKDFMADSFNRSKEWPENKLKILMEKRMRCAKNKVEKGIWLLSLKYMT